MKLFVIDTNVILLAGSKLRDIPNDQLLLFEKCILFLSEIMNDGSEVLLDDECRVIHEYEHAYKINSYPNFAAMFLEYTYEHARFIHINALEENVYEKYPDDYQLKTFDPPDRKFIALAYNSTENAPIVEAADSKWWGIVDSLSKFGIEVIFIDENYIRNKYHVKMGGI